MNGRMIPVTIFFLALCFHMLDTHDKPSSNRKRHRCGNCALGRKKERELVKHITKKLDRKYKKTLETFKRDIDKLKNDTKKAIGRLERERSCPVGFLRFKHHCFQFVMSPTMWRKWEDARDYCQGASANLLFLNSTKKHEFIAKYLRENFAGQNDSEVFTSGIYSDTTFIPHQWNPKKEVNPKSLEWFWEGKRSPVGNDISILHWYNKVIPKPEDITNLKSCLLLSSSRKWQWVDEKHVYSVYTSGIFCDERLVPYSWDPGVSRSTVNADWTWQGKNRDFKDKMGSSEGSSRKLVGTDPTTLQWCQDKIPKETLLSNMNSCLILSRTCEWHWSAGKCGVPRPFVCEMDLVPSARKCNKC